MHAGKAVFIGNFKLAKVVAFGVFDAQGAFKASNVAAAGVAVGNVPQNAVGNFTQAAGFLYVNNANRFV